MDVVSRHKRSQMMSGIQGKNTTPEIIIRKQLHKLGFRFRLHNRSLPGKPDIVLRKHNAVIFVHGCFWHRHNCHLFKWPKTRPEFWRKKIDGNAERDKKNLVELSSLDWRVCIVWECALKGSKKKDHAEIAAKIARWLTSEKGFLEISG